MTDRATERRLRAVEKKMGVTGNPLEHLSDLDLLTAVETVTVKLTADGHEDAAAMLAHHDAEEASSRAFYERPDIAGTCRLVLEPGVRWPYLRARVRWQEANYGQDEPRSATSETDLWAKLTPVLAMMASAR